MGAPNQALVRFHGRATKLAVAAMALLGSSVMGSSASEASKTYAGEKISWHPCGQAKGHALECSKIIVPMDQFNATNSGNKTFSLPLIRLRGRNATQNVLINPGGPGGSGMANLYVDGPAMHDVVGEGYHILSFDPRGVNGSRPAAKCYPNKALRTRYFSLSDPDALSRSKERYAWTHNFVEGCARNMGDYGPYINTPQTAADMNSILDAVGQKDMFYWGFSYGTLLGQTYAGLFPKRSKRVIIDGVSNVFDWYDSPVLRNDFLDSWTVFEGFMDECIKAGDLCALSRFAHTKDELEVKLKDLLRQLEANPIPVYVDAARQGLVTYNLVLQSLIYQQLYEPKTWSDLALRLAELLNGNATQTLLQVGLQSETKDAAEELVDIISINDGPSGPEHWPKGREALVKYLTPFYESSPFFYQMNREYYAKQQWLIPRRHNYSPPRRVRLAHPMLVVATTWDPVCPLVSAKLAQEAFEDSSLIEIKGYGHCSLALLSLCMARHLRAYLDHGTMPARHTMCDADLTYFPPESKTA